MPRSDAPPLATARSGRWAAALALALIALFAGTVPADADAHPADAAAHRPDAPVCTTYRLPVRLSDPGPADQVLRGRLCYPSGHRPDTVQLLVPGSTYNHLYWDFPAAGAESSYVRAAVAAGYATFDVDPIGTGASSHPPSALATVPATATALHDAVTALCTGGLDAHAFSRVVWVGHSLGSIHAWYEIPRYHDIDAAVLTGALHHLNPAAPDPTYPAVQDPKFAGSGLDAGYRTTRPGTRGDAFYHPATADPAVIAADEAAKDATPLPASPPAPTPLDFAVPTLVVLGAQDRSFCQGATAFDCARPGTVAAFESQYYTAGTPLTALTVPDTGHVLSLSTTAPGTHAAMLRWVRTVAAPGPQGAS
ncbi:alpha/beta hydrolase [Streptomyces sp. NPDC003717]|uniref:alpha/beta hydrolase n=1 Tax=Streptomyces sp. NPDC003717 TaxID=3154276 RepID=UPI00339ED23C